MRRNLRRAQLRAAASRGRSAGGARSGRRRRVRRRPGAQHPLPESAGGAIARHRGRATRSASSAATCSSPAAPGSAARALRDHRVSRSCARARPAARSRWSSCRRARGTRQTVITSSRIVNGLQVQVLRDETELEGVRRARDTVLANVIARIPHAARGAARLHRAAARRVEDEPARTARGAGAVAGARHAAAHAAHRQPARERAHRVGPARRAPPEPSSSPTSSTTRARSSRRCCASAASRSRWSCPKASSCRAMPRASRRCSSISSPTPASSRPRAHRSASARASKAISSAPGSRTRGRACPKATPSESFERFKRGGAQEPEPGGLGLGLVDLAFDRRAPRRQHHRRPHRRRPHPLHAHAAGGARQGTSRMKILVADDDLDLLGLVAYSLTQAGYLVVKASDGHGRARDVRRRIAGSRDPRHQHAGRVGVRGVHRHSRARRRAGHDADRARRGAGPGARRWSSAPTTTSPSRSARRRCWRA